MPCCNRLMCPTLTKKTNTLNTTTKTNTIFDNLVFFNVLQKVYIPKNLTLLTPTSLKSDFSSANSSCPEISCSRNAWQYIARPIASNHCETAVGDHWSTISTIHVESLLAKDDPPTQESTDGIRETPECPDPKDPRLECEKLPREPWWVGWEPWRPNLGTRNQEFRRTES